MGFFAPDLLTSPSLALLLLLVCSCGVAAGDSQPGWWKGLGAEAPFPSHLPARRPALVLPVVETSRPRGPGSACCCFHAQPFPPLPPPDQSGISAANLCGGNGAGREEGTSQGEVAPGGWGWLGCCIWTWHLPEPKKNPREQGYFTGPPPPSSSFAVFFCRRAMGRRLQPAAAAYKPNRAPLKVDSRLGHQEEFLQEENSTNKVAWPREKFVLTRFSKGFSGFPAMGAVLAASQPVTARWVKSGTRNVSMPGFAGRLLCKQLPRLVPQFPLCNPQCPAEYLLGSRGEKKP